MSDHLPECPVPEMDGLWGLPMHPEDAKANCICPQLRACEQRVLDAVREALKGLASHMANWSSAETVAATNAIPDLNVEQWMWAQRGVYRAIAAIDALRQERSGNSDTSPSAENEAIDALREDK